jgi:hypothetical protein
VAGVQQLISAGALLAKLPQRSQITWKWRIQWRFWVKTSQIFHEILA